MKQGRFGGLGKREEWLANDSDSHSIDLTDLFSAIPVHSRSYLIFTVRFTCARSATRSNNDHSETGALS